MWVKSQEATHSLTRWSRMSLWGVFSLVKSAMEDSMPSSSLVTDANSALILSVVDELFNGYSRANTGIFHLADLIVSLTADNESHDVAYVEEIAGHLVPGIFAGLLGATLPAAGKLSAHLKM